MDIEAITVPALHEVVAGHAQRRPDANAIRFEGDVLSYLTLDRLANRVAHSLTRDGVGADDRVILIGRNSAAFPILALGANKIGAVPVPLNWRLAPAEIGAQIVDSEAHLVFAEPEFADHAAAVPKEVAERITVRSAAELNGQGDWLCPDETPPDPQSDPTKTALQIYTSGTTGVAKGVMLSHRNLLGVNSLRADNIPWDTWSEDDVSLVTTPLGHIGGFGMMVRGLYFGGEVIIQPTFDAGEVIAAIEQYAVSKIALVPTAIKMVIDHPRARQIDYSRIDTMMYGASPISLPLLREAMEVFKCRFAQSYGMSETSSTIVALSPDDHDLAGNPRMEAAGQAMPGVEVRITNEAGTELPLGEIGEICVRSIATMQGYWRRPEETASVLSADGWLRTGDAGFMDADGYIFVRSRVKDMIISGAENIYPTEVENAISGHPDISEVAVIGVPDARWGEAVKAIVIAKPGHTIDPASVIDWARQRIAAYKVPKSIDIVDELPLNASGKVDKRRLREAFWKDVGREVN